MCESIVLLSGNEIQVVGDILDCGLADKSSPHLPTKYNDDSEEYWRKNCLCRVDVENLLMGLDRRFVHERYGLWEEVDENGITWMKDAWIVDESKNNNDHITHVKVDPNYPYRIPGNEKNEAFVI